MTITSPNATRTRDIRGVTYRCTRFPASINFPLSVRVGELLGEALSTPGAFELLAGKGLKEADLSVIGPVLARAFAKLAMINSMEFALTLLSSTVAVRPDLENNKIVNVGKVEGFDIAFSDQSSRVPYEVLAFSIEVNFGDFFDVSA